MRLRDRRMLRILAIWGLSTSLALAALPPPYDFTGQWSGTAVSNGGGGPRELPLFADFSATANPRKFTGTATLGNPNSPNISCTFKAKYKHALKLHTDCNGKKGTLTVKFDPAALTLMGSFPIGKHGHTATFTLTRSSG